MPPPNSSDPSAEDWAEIARKLGGTADMWAAAAAKLGTATDKLANGGAAQPDGPAPGHVRLYHGGTDYGADETGGRWVAGDKEYARGWADRTAGAHLQYVDVPETHPQVREQLDAAEHATGKRDPRAISHFELEAEWASKLRREGEQAKPAGDAAGPGVADLRDKLGGKPVVVPAGVDDLASKLSGGGTGEQKAPRGGPGRMLRRLISGTRTFRRTRALGRGLKAAGTAANAAGYGRLGSALGGAGSAASAAAGPLAAIAALVQFGEAVHGATGALLDSQAKLAHASGAMASVMAEREIQEIRRDQRQGAKLAGTARDLERSEQYMKDNLEPIETLITNIKNTSLASMERILADILAPLTLMAEYVNKLAFGEPKEDPLAAMLMRTADEAEAAIARGDVGFTRPDVARHRP